MTQEINCSDAARMLIERMQTHPEDFDYGGKMYRMAEQAQMSARDKKACTDAHDAYIKEPRLMAEVLKALLAQEERYAIRATDPKMLYGSSIQDDLTVQQRITREMYEDHINTHRDLIRDGNAHKSPIKKQVVAVAAAQIYDRAFGRERVERDN